MGVESTGPRSPLQDQLGGAGAQRPRQWTGKDQTAADRLLLCLLYSSASYTQVQVDPILLGMVLGLFSPQKRLPSLPPSISPVVPVSFENLGLFDGELNWELGLNVLAASGSKWLMKFGGSWAPGRTSPRNMDICRGHMYTQPRRFMDSPHRRARICNALRVPGCSGQS